MSIIQKIKFWPLTILWFSIASFEWKPHLWAVGLDCFNFSGFHMFQPICFEMKSRKGCGKSSPLLCAPLSRSSYGATRLMMPRCPDGGAGLATVSALFAIYNHLLLCQPCISKFDIRCFWIGAHLLLMFDFANEHRPVVHVVSICGQAACTIPLADSEHKTSNVVPAGKVTIAHASDKELNNIAGQQWKSSSSTRSKMGAPQTKDLKQEQTSKCRKARREEQSIWLQGFKRSKTIKALQNNTNKK